MVVFAQEPTQEHATMAFRTIIRLARRHVGRLSGWWSGIHTARSDSLFVNGFEKMASAACTTTCTSNTGVVVLLRNIMLFKGAELLCIIAGMSRGRRPAGAHDCGL